jgi:hypothetical protein
MAIYRQHQRSTPGHAAIVQEMRRMLEQGAND